MKKALVLMLALIMVWGLVGCSSAPAEEATSTPQPAEELSVKDMVIGTWVYEFDQEQNTIAGSIGDKMRKVVELYKGGTGRIYWHNDTQDVPGSNVTLTWELTEDDIININYSISMESSEGFEYIKDSDTLVSVDGKQTFTREN